MTTELMNRAKAVELFRKKSGDLTFPRYSILAGVRFVQERVGKDDVVRLDLDGFCRAFHGVACASARKRTKPQVRRLIRTFIEDGQLAMPEYADDGRLVGMIYVQNIPDDDEGGIMEMVNECMGRARRQKDFKELYLSQLDNIVAQLLHGDGDDDGDAQ